MRTIASRDLVISFRSLSRRFPPLDDDLVGSREPARTLPETYFMRRQRATERIDPINRAQGFDIQDIVITASDGPRKTVNRALETRSSWKVLIQKTMQRDRSDGAKIDPRIDPKLAGAIAAKQCGIGSPSRARTYDLRINSPPGHSSESRSR